MIPIVPQSGQAIADPDGRVTTVWQRFFAGLVGKPDSIAAVTVTASPFTYTASGPGFVSIIGGTFSAATLNRAGTAIAFGTTTRAIPVGQGDKVTVTYTVAPTISFVPS